jgi:nicotinamide mononucleotide (NMN) deamidase PncC
MFMLLQTSMSICFSGVAGGGVCGKVVGIVHVIMTGAGVITTVFQYSILM